MKNLLIATHNPAKVTEIKLGLKPLTKFGIKLITISDLKIKDKPEETGNTFEENALLKAKFYADISKLPTVSDDGGVAIKELNGEPGVKSRMWLGYEATDEELINHTLKELKGKAMDKRKAYLETCLCFFDPKSLNFLAEKNGFQVESVDYYGLDIMDFLFMKTYDDGFDYLTGLKEFIPVMQAVLDKQKLSNHQRVVFKKI